MWCVYNVRVCCVYVMLGVCTHVCVLCDVSIMWCACVYMWCVCVCVVCTCDVGRVHVCVTVTAGLGAEGQGRNQEMLM